MNVVVAIALVLTPRPRIFRLGQLPVEEACVIDVDDAKILEEAKAILKKIMEPSPDPEEERIEI